MNKWYKLKDNLVKAVFNFQIKKLIQTEVIGNVLDLELGGLYRGSDYNIPDYLPVTYFVLLTKREEKRKQNT